MLSSAGIFLPGAGRFPLTFDKPALSLPDLVQLLQDKGLEGDPQLIERRLRAVGYHRLSPYWRQGRDVCTGQLSPGTSIELVWRRYRFDRELRLLVLDAIERVEVAVRATVVSRQAVYEGL